MYESLKNKLEQELADIKANGLYKNERIITTPQGADIATLEGGEVINFCANNYLGLSSHPKVIQAAKDAIDTHGYGMSSVRFICGTQDIHKELKKSYLNLWVRKTLYSTQQLLTQMEAFLSHFTTRVTQSYQTH